LRIISITVKRYEKTIIFIMSIKIIGKAKNHDEKIEIENMIKTISYVLCLIYLKV